MSNSQFRTNRSVPHTESRTYEGVSFDIAKAIFVNDGWLDSNADKDPKILKRAVVFTESGNNLSVRVIKNDAVFTTQDAVLLNPGLLKQDLSNRADLTEDMLENNVNTKACFMFSVNLNLKVFGKFKGLYTDNSAVMTQDLPSTDKKYIAHAAWLIGNDGLSNAGTWDDLTKLLIALPGIDTSHTPSPADIGTANPYYMAYTAVAKNLSALSDKIQSDMKLDENRYTAYLTLLSSSGVMNNSRQTMMTGGSGFSFTTLFSGKQKKAGKSAKRKSSTKRTQKRC
jgi:hypothetical protein